MLKRDSSARFWCREEPVLETRELAPGITTTVQTGIKKFWRFRAGGTHTQGELEDGEYLALLEFQEHTPGLVMKSGIGKKRWWMFQDEFYCEDEGYTEEEMKALVLDRLEQKARKVKRAIDRLENPVSLEEELPPLPPLPDPIPNHIKLPPQQGDTRIWKWKSMNEWGKEISRNGIERAAISRWYRFREDIDEYYLFRFKLGIGTTQHGEPRDYFGLRSDSHAQLRLNRQMRRPGLKKPIHDLCLGPWHSTDPFTNLPY